MIVPDRSHTAVKLGPFKGPTVASEVNPPLLSGSTMKIGTLVKAPMGPALPSATRAFAWPMVMVWKSASAVRKHLVRVLLHSAGRSVIHSADVRWHEDQAALTVALLPLAASAMARTNLPAVYILAKVGVASRGEAAAAAHRLRLSGAAGVP